MLELCINNYLHNTPNNERVHEFVIVQDGECTLRDFLLEAARQCHDSAISKLLNALTRQVEWRTLIRYMQRRGTAVVSDDGELVKFVGPGPAQPMTAFNYFVRYFYSTPTSAGITESERAIVHLRQTLRMLKARIEKLETQMARYKSEAASYKTKGDKRMTQMKFKLLVETEKQRQSTASTLLKLEGVYSDISAAETNMAVLACYKSATIALRESRRVTQSDGSVSVVDMESIQDVISAFEEEMQISQDIGETLGQSQEDATDEDLEELEAALAALSTSDTAPATNHSQSTMSSTTPLHVEPPINDPVLSCQDPPKHIPVPTKQTTEEKETVSY